MKKYIILVIFFICFFFLWAAYVVNSGPKTPLNIPHGVVSDSFSSTVPKTLFSKFNLVDVQSGAKRNLGELMAGKIAVVNIWATWCPPCRAEIPDLIAINNKYGTTDVILIGVSVDKDGAEKVKRFVKDNGINYPILLDDGMVSQEFSVNGIPTTLFVDAEGNVVSTKVGSADEAFFSRQLDKMLHK